MKDFIESVVATAERYRELPNKFIDTNLVLLGLLILSLTVGVSVLYLKLLVVDSCVMPVFPLEQKR